MSCQCNTMLCRIYLYPITSLVKISATTLIIFISRYNGPKMQWCTYLLCYNGIGPCKAYPKYEGMTINSYLINLRKLSIDMLKPVIKDGFRNVPLKLTVYGSSAMSLHEI